MFPVIDKKKTAERISAIMKVYGKTPADIQNYLKLSCVQTVYRWLEGQRPAAGDTRSGMPCRWAESGILPLCILLGLRLLAICGGIMIILRK